MILTKENIKSVDIDFLINEKIMSGRLDELLLILPTNRKVRNLKKDFISLVPGKAVSGMNIETLGTISSKLLKNEKPFVQLSEAASVVFIRQSAEEVKLKYFSAYKNDIPFGTLDRIKNVINEYKRHGISPQNILDESGKLDKSEKLKAQDIAAVYDKYLEKCRKLNAFDIGDVFNYLNETDSSKFVEILSKEYPKVDLIIVNGFDEFALPEINIINKLSNSKAHRLFINFDYNQKNNFLFNHLDKIYTQFEKIGFKKISDNTPSEADEFRSEISDKLFRIHKTKIKTDYKDKISKIIAHDREKEIELIAREIKQTITDKKVEPHKICVAFNLISNYSTLIRDNFTKNGLPFNLSDRISLDNSKSVTAVINFLEIAENDFYYNNIFRALSSGFIELEGIDYSNLFRVSSELKIVSGKNNWINSLEDELGNINYKSDEDDIELGRLKESYAKALEDIKFIAQKLSPFDGKLTIPEFKERLFDFINELKLPFKLLHIGEGSDSDISEENVRGFTNFIDTITEIFKLLEEEKGNGTKFNLRFFMDQMRTACGWARFNIKEKSDYGVQVTTLEEIRGLQFDYLFIGGMCDGDLPTRYSPEIFYSGTFKKQAFTHQTEERNLFYQALCCWNKKLFLSYPQTESGRETVASTFLNDFEELFEISIIDESVYSDTIFSKEELQIAAGENGFDKLPENIISKIESESIKKSIEINKIREEGAFADSPFTGHLNSADENVLQKLNSYSQKQYSISQLETYAKCPFKFFVERVLGIEKIEEPTEDIEAIEMGRLLHEILFEFYTKIRDAGIEISGSDEKTFSKIKNIIWKIAEEQIQSTAFKSPLTFYEKEKITGIGGNKEESILNRFLEAERNDEGGHTPKYFEVSFGRIKKEGSDQILSNSDPVQIDGTKLRGKIDRIEINEDEKSFNVVDYKLSGKKPTFQELKQGISLQLPLYLYAAGGLLKKKFGDSFNPNEMIIYSLKYSMNEFGKVIVKLSNRKDEEIKTIEQLIANTIEHIKTYIDQISKGKFGLSPHDNREQLVCGYCRFKPVCRVEEISG